MRELKRYTAEELKELPDYVIEQEFSGIYCYGLDNSSDNMYLKLIENELIDRKYTRDKLFRMFKETCSILRNII